VRGESIVIRASDPSLVMRAKGGEVEAAIKTSGFVDCTSSAGHVPNTDHDEPRDGAAHGLKPATWPGAAVLMTGSRSPNPQGRERVYDVRLVAARGPWQRDRHPRFPIDTATAAGSGGEVAECVAPSRTRSGARTAPDARRHRTAGRDLGLVVASRGPPREGPVPDRYTRTCRR